ncbi:MAG TPA: response regulator [Ramlibacter sp.]|nr:response regulator [Ramlibacter sp.]
MPRARSLLPAFFLLLLLTVFSATAAARQPVALQGQIDAPPDARKPVRLDGQWGFVWQQFVDPRWTTLPARGFAEAPSSWNDLTADGKPPGQNGWGSYVLQVNCPAGTSLAVEAMGQRTASRLFVNGALIAAHGEPGASPATSRAAVYTHAPISPEFACPLRVTLHVSNFDHRSGGFVRGLRAGPADTLMQRREARVMYGAGVLAIYLLTGFIALVFFLANRRERVPLVFGLFCVAMAVYTDLLGERMALRLFTAEMSWVAFMRIEYLSWIAAMGLFLNTLTHLFPAEIDRRVAAVVMAALGLGALSVFVFPPAVYSHVVVPGQLAAVLVTAYLAIAIMRADGDRRADARLLLLGMVAVVAAMTLDLALIDVVMPDRKFAPLGFALFMLSPAVIIARRMSRGLNAEERARALEENARLREDVERMSRHDLKTPLNSILGVTRLLGDDATLAPHQRDLVGILEGAGLRMLEMVNISLDLFKMETGAYIFQPEPVDLRDVATRVLSDLNPLALERRVALRIQGPDMQPLWAQADGLLCYSILANLVKNAIEAAQAGEQVTVTLKRADPVCVRIHNPGIVSGEVVDRFFEKYVTSGKKRGTGLGTYSALLMAQAQHGNLTMRTDAANGTTVTLTLRAAHRTDARPSSPAPLASREPTPAAAAAPAPVAVGAAGHALVVDDDRINTLVLSRFLGSADYEVDTAPDGLAATEAMLQRWPDVLFLDMEMPRMNGLETLRWVREREASHGERRCRVVILSGHDDQATAARALTEGADEFLVKPTSREQVLRALGEPSPQ